MKLKVIITDKYNDVTQLVKENGGYCPCAILRNEGTLCMCKEFREQNHEGECRCGRFKKVEE